MNYSFKHIIKNITFKTFQSYCSKMTSTRKHIEFIIMSRHLTDKFQCNGINKDAGTLSPAMGQNPKSWSVS